MAELSGVIDCGQSGQSLLVSMLNGEPIVVRCLDRDGVGFGRDMGHTLELSDSLRISLMRGSW
jgi:hypothetical protein